MKTKYKRISFDIELAKKITNKTVEGHIITREGKDVKILCFNRCDKTNYPIVALIKDKFDWEKFGLYSDKGSLNIGCESCNDLFITVPNYAKYDYFIPKRMQPCVVRDTFTDLWEVGVCRGTNSNKVPIFYSRNNSDGFCHWKYFLPLTKVTERLICTNKSYKELINELNKE